VSWQEFVTHGVEAFGDALLLKNRQDLIESALGGLCDEIARTATKEGLCGLERAKSLRTRPAEDRKSLYECLNQLIHYWYSCAAGIHLYSRGYENIVLRPTGTYSKSKKNDHYDIVAAHLRGQKVVGEVFCVSEVFWSTKMQKTKAKLNKHAPVQSRRLIYYNTEARKAPYSPRTGRFVIFGISPAGSVELISSTENRLTPGLIGS
jgi:hypothetical protein